MTCGTPTIDASKVPRAAMHFAAAKAMQFSEGDAVTGILPFRMIARSAEAISHYYWGRIVHDFSGMILRKESVTVDYAHGFDEVIGFANQFSVTEAGLEVSGSLVTTEPNDKADEVYRKGKAGVPYEASIDWDGPEVEIEYIPELVTTEVNGQQFSGPGYVVRKWPLRAIAVCRYGCDPSTKTQFSQPENEATVAVSILSPSAEVKQMSTSPTAPAAGATVPAVEKQLSQPGGISLDTLKQFSAEFGAKGIEFLSSGLSIDAARYQFAVHERDLARAESLQFSSTITAKDAEIATLQTQLKQFGVTTLGEVKPVSTGGKDDSKKQFASLVRLPGGAK